MRGLDEADETARLLAEAATDRRGGWRATKAKGHRRNRRYEKRLLSGASDSLVELQWETED